MSDVKGRPARVEAKLPVWRAEDILRDIDNLVRVWTMADGTTLDSGLYPLALHDFRTELGAAIEAAKEMR